MHCQARCFILSVHNLDACVSCDLVHPGGICVQTQVWAAFRVEHNWILKPFIMSCKTISLNKGTLSCVTHMDSVAIYNALQV